MANASRSAQMAQLAQARQGDEAALAGIIARMMPVVNAAAARAVCPGLEFEDAVQEGLVGLFCAVRTYKGGAGTAFSTYAAACVRNAGNSAARAASPVSAPPARSEAPPYFLRGPRRSSPTAWGRVKTRTPKKRPSWPNGAAASKRETI